MSQQRLDPYLIEEIKAISGYTESEIYQLFNKFLALDPKDGEISLVALLRLPELSMPLASRVPRALGLAATKTLNFKAFVKALSVFHLRTPTEEKISFLFRLYDGDGDERISRAELKKTLTLLAGDEDPTLLDYAVNKTFAEIGDPEAQYLTKEDFIRGLAGVDINRIISFRWGDEN
jgi:serine/threonine-protein phosphatase 2B regulatory subunit